MYLLNIDKPTKSCTLHFLNCYTILLEGTKRKGIDHLLEDGGWIKFTSKEEAISSYDSEYKGFSFKDCGKCMKRDLA
jgi:hypothetical protein